MKKKYHNRSVIFRNSLYGFILLVTSSFLTPDAHPFESKIIPKGITNYYVAPDGDDSNPGTARLPWKSLDKVNQILQAGDTVTFLDGTYNGIISPVNSGTNNKQTIIYRCEKRHGAILRGQEGSRYIINLADKHFITIDGFMMLPLQGGFGYMRNCDHIILQNCHMEGSSKVYCPLEFIDSHHNRLLYNKMTRVIQRTSDPREGYDKIHGDGCHFINASYNLIEGNDFSKIGHSPLRLWGTNPHQAGFNVIRGNYFHNGWGRNFEMFNLDRSLFEGNIISDAYNGAKSADSRGKVFLTDGIFRNCLIYDNWDSPLASDSYIDKPTTGNVPLELKNSRIYNNTFANNTTFLWSFGSSTGTEPIRANIFMNNLFFNNDFTGDFNTLMMNRPGCTEDNLFHNNLFFGAEKDQAVINILDKRYTATALNQALPARCRDNMDADPRFISVPNRCFALSKDSPARNAGRVLTQTAGSGSGTSLPVMDARCFFDGFGIEGEQGDIIVIGKKKLMARILKADIATNILTLDRQLSWKENDPVSLPYAGTSPDIGAFQEGNTGIFTIIPFIQPILSNPGQPVSFSALVSGSKTSLNYEWDFGDGNISRDESPKHTYKNPGDYIVRLHCTEATGTSARGIFLVRIESTDTKAPLVQTKFEEDDFELWGYLWDSGYGERGSPYYPEPRDDNKGKCMCVPAATNNSKLATNIKMRIWDIDKYPFIRFSYRIPKDVPVGVWLDPWPSKSRPERICAGGSPKNSAGTLPNLGICKLIDDGQWHDAVVDARIVRKLIPDIKLLHTFEFFTYGQAVEGQKFWFDDFAITQ